MTLEIHEPHDTRHVLGEREGLSSRAGPVSESPGAGLVQLPRVALYSVGTWDMDLEAYTPQVGVPAFNLTIRELRKSLRMLRECGYTAHRTRARDGEHESDPHVLVERTDGKSEADILDGWKR